MCRRICSVFQHVTKPAGVIPVLERVACGRRFCANLTTYVFRDMSPIWAVVLLSVVGAALPARAQEWTRFRGPNGQGVSEKYDLPARWTPDDYQWSLDLPGIGHSSPVAWGSKVFITSADPETATQHILCVDLKTGRQLWRRDFPAVPYHLHSRASFACATPTVDAECVYVAWATPDSVILKALDHEGRERWTRDLGPFISQHGFGTSPMLFEDLLIFSNSQQEARVPKDKTPGKSTLVALNKKTGETVWEIERHSVRVCYTVPCIYRDAQGKPQLIHYNTGDGFYAVNPRTGEILWTVPEVFRMRTVSSPVLAAGKIFGSTGSGGGGNYVVAIDMSGTPKVAYTIDRQAPYVPTPVARGDLLFLFSDKGIVTCVDADSGKVHWKKRVNAAFSGSPIRVKDKLYCITESGEVLVLAAEKEFRELGRNALGERSRATPAVCNGRMLLRTYSHLYCLGNAGV